MEYLIIINKRQLDECFALLPFNCSAKWEVSPVLSLCEQFTPRHHMRWWLENTDVLYVMQQPLPGFVEGWVFRFNVLLMFFKAPPNSLCPKCALLVFQGMKRERDSEEGIIETI